jgi:4-hydroxybenzoate polyprenyltransferase
MPIGTAQAYVYEHSLVSPRDFSRVNRVFFTVNSYFAVAVFCGLLAAVRPQAGCQ